MPIKGEADRSLEIKHAALRYRECGLSCIPLLPFSKRPDYMAVRDSLTFKSLRLARVGTYRRRRASKETLSRWFRRDSNLALVSGYDGMFALDFDDEASYRDWSLAFPSIARNTATQRSHRGYHVLLKSSNPPACAKARFGGRVFGDIIGGNGSWLVAWPSIHPDGTQYQWLPDMAPWEVGLLTVASLEETGVSVEYPKRWPTLAVAAQLVATRDWEEFRKRIILKAGMLPLLNQLRANPKNADGKLRK